MESMHTEVLVIGWGKGGKTLAGKLGRAGRRVTVVEQSDDMVGGTCINIACVPTKALVTSASRRRDDDDAIVWFSAAVDGRDALVGKLRAANHAMLDTVDAVTLVSGRAAFSGPRQIVVRAGEDELSISADTVLINTGSVPRVLPIPGASGPRVYDSTTIQHADPLPTRLVVVGAGPIGLEFASMFRGFGSEVVLVNSGSVLLPREDRDVASAVEEVLASDGIEIRHGVRAAAIETTDTATLVVRLTSASDPEADAGAVTGDAVLLATGRAPATADLGLERAGVEVDERGFVRVDERLRTAADGVWAIGDVHGGAQQTYLSLDDSRIIGAQLTGDGERSVDDRRAVPTTIFTTPPYGAVGMTEAEAIEQGRRVVVARKDVATIAAAPRPKIVGDPRGIVKFVVDADTDLILGARLFVVDAQELVNLIALAMRAGVTASALRDGIWTHPSTTELLNEVLAELT